MHENQYGIMRLVIQDSEEYNMALTKACNTCPKIWLLGAIPQVIRHDVVINGLIVCLLRDLSTRGFPLLYLRGRRCVIVLAAAHLRANPKA